MAEENKRKANNIERTPVVLVILLLLSVLGLKNVLELPISYFSSPEIAGYLTVPIIIWVSTIWFGVKLYKEFKNKGKQIHERKN